MIYGVSQEFLVLLNTAEVQILSSLFAFAYAVPLPVQPVNLSCSGSQLRQPLLLCRVPVPALPGASSQALHRPWLPVVYEPMPTGQGELSARRASFRL